MLNSKLLFKLFWGNLKPFEPFWTLLDQSKTLEPENKLSRVSGMGGGEPQYIATGPSLSWAWQYLFEGMHFYFLWIPDTDT